MTDIVKNALQGAVSFVPFVVLAFLNAKLNLKKINRSRQFLMPVIALLFCIAALILVQRIYYTAQSLIDSLYSAAENYMQTYASDASFELPKLNLGYLAFYLANTIILAVFIVFKRVIITFLSLIFRNDNVLYEKIAGLFYEKDEKSGKWYIGRHCLQARTFLRTFYVVSVIVSGAGLVLTGLMYLNGSITEPWYPVFLVIMTGEMSFFVGGLSKKEAKGSIEMDEEEEQQVRDYSVMRKVLRKLFPDKLGAENTTVNDSDNNIGGLDELITNLENSSDFAQEAYGRFLRAQVKSGTQIDCTYAMSGSRLLKGESVMFNNPFYYDLIPYVTYPMNRVLLRHKKVLIVLGRHGGEKAAEQWAKEGIYDVTHIDEMWNIGVLTEKPQELDIGIITRSDVHNLKLHEANREFFSQTEFVVLLEPSKLITTAQIGLNSIVRFCRSDVNKQLSFCSADINSDGMLDALSHILMTSLTEVQATDHPNGTSSYMCWDGDSQHLQHRMLPNLSRYLGMGTELSFAALKNQISQTWWYGGDAFPVVDIRWIAQQYYYDLLRYAQLPTVQSKMDEVFTLSADIWSAKAGKHRYITVEDESCNMFEIKRNYATRSTKQGFVNVISPQYLLKDYMAENDSIFNADSKAIARISADYSRSVRNVILRLCLRMSSGMVPESEICRELSLIDRDTTHPMQALWNEMCHVCSSVGSVTDDRDGVPILTCTFPEGDVSFTNKVLGVRRRFSLDSGEMENMYYVSDRRFISIVVSGLQNAQYIAEDENGDYLYLGSEVHGHIFQKYLPGQFFTFSGKYYEVLRVTNEGKVIVRRAADHINGRPAYRQCRIYTITNAVDSTVMGESRCKGAVSIRRQYADFYVQTPAYWDMDGYNNFKTGKRVEISGIPVRYYRNKAIIKMDINLPNADETVMATLALLTNEVLRTVLADNACYASVVTAHQMPEPVTYSLRGENGIELDEKSIYIIEDSQLDIGILDAVERNLDRIFEIICDYLNWNDEAIEKSKNPPPPEPDVEYTIPEGSQPQGKQPKTKLGRFIKKIIDKLFGRFKKKKPISPQQPEAPVQPETEIEQPAEPEQPSQPEETIDSAQQNTEVKDQVSPENEQPENVQPDNNDDHGDEINASETFILHDDAPKATLEFEEEELVKPMQSIERRPYHERYYLLYCGCDGAHRLDTNGVKSLLTELGFAEGALRMARDGKDIAAQIERNFVPGKPGSHYCDFCGDELVGTEYDTLADGRERCRNCSRTAIRSREKFVQLYENVTSNMLTLFGVKIEVPVTIQMVNAKKLHSKLGKSFTPTQRVDARTLGFAMKRGNEYTIMLENGSPRLMSAMTMVHELTHIWQYTNWDSDEILRLYGHEQETEIYEGMAKWIEIQYAYLIGETAAAKREEIITRCRDDVYGHGFVKYAKKYPLKISGGGSIKTPFDNPHKPL